MIVFSSDDHGSKASCRFEPRESFALSSAMNSDQGFEKIGVSNLLGDFAFTSNRQCHLKCFADLRFKSGIVFMLVSYMVVSGSYIRTAARMYSVTESRLNCKISLRFNI